jgi:hypothetical protein
VDERAIGATPITGSATPPRSFPKGRVCNETGCETRLSIYHEGQYCYRHERPTTMRMRGKKIA